MNNLYKLPITNKEKWNETYLSKNKIYFFNGRESLYITEHYSCHDMLVENNIDFLDTKYEGIQLRWNFKINLD